MKEIQFLPKTLDAEILVDVPTPARKSIPSWFSKMPAFHGGKPNIDQENGGTTNATVKMCIPMTDSFSMGYIQTTWTDIYVDHDEDGNAKITLGTSEPPLLTARSELTHTPSSEFYSTEFAWQSQWIPKVPKGYSVLYTHPLNRDDLPFLTFSGVVDSDDYHYELGANHPFLLKKDFTGMIPRGTPMFQMIPFKRDDWKSKKVDYDETHELRASKIKQKFWGAYKDMFWKKKTFL